MAAVDLHTVMYRENWERHRGRTVSTVRVGWQQLTCTPLRKEKIWRDLEELRCDSTHVSVS